MYYDEEHDRSGFLAGLLVGALIGMGVALLAAPQEGAATRRRLLSAVPRRLRFSGDGGDDDFEGDVKAAVRAGRRRAGH